MGQYANRKQKREKMFNHIDRYYSSNLSKKAFCQQEDISYSTFLFWLGKYDQEKRDNGKGADAGSFIPIQIKSSEPKDIESSCSFSIEYPTGVILHIHGEPDIQLVTKLIHAQAG